MMRGINCGSGQRRFTTVPECQWINLDAVSRPGMEPDVVGNALELASLFDRDSFDYVVFHHVLEHLWRNDAKPALAGARHILREGGSLIVIVPDPHALAVRWLTGALKGGDEEYFTHMFGAYMGDAEDLHKWHYTPAMLRSLIRDVGEWQEVKTFDWRNIPGADIAAKDFWFHGVEAIR